MPSFNVDMSNEEYKDLLAYKAETGKTNREIMLEAIGKDPEKRPLGRPKSKLDLYAHGKPQGNLTDTFAPWRKEKNQK
ncbi:MAG: hypothetical protein NWF05_08955 [Candidatus Bathyarchaeota archaeon]|nr:hypothetical protein [Candidatus Bathyarchaeota archaeon]